MGGRCMNAAMELLKPLLTQGGSENKGKVCIGTVRGDLHDIGKNLVRIMLEGSGFEVLDLGVDVAPETFVQTAREENCDIIACSTLLTTTMHEMRAVTRLAEEAGIRDRVKIMIGWSDKHILTDIQSCGERPSAAKPAVFPLLILLSRGERETFRSLSAQQPVNQLLSGG